MYISNGKTTVILGYKESTYTRELFAFCPANDKIIISPEDFLKMNNKQNYQYVLGFSKDKEQRQYIINKLDEEELFSPTFIHDTAVVYTDISNIGPGTSIAAFCTIMTGAKIGRHSVFEPYGLIAHDVNIGDNCMFRSGVMIAGKATIGNNVTIGLKSSVIESVSVCNDVDVGSLSNVTKDITEPGRYVGSRVKKVSD